MIDWLYGFAFGILGGCFALWFLGFACGAVSGYLVSKKKNRRIHVHTI